MSDNIINGGFGTPAEDEDMDVERIFGGKGGSDADPPLVQEPAPIAAAADTACDSTEASDTASADTQSADTNSGTDNAAPADTSPDSTETPAEGGESTTDTATPVETGDSATKPEKPGKPARKSTGRKPKETAAESSDEEPVKDLFALLENTGEADTPLPAADNTDSSHDEPQSIADRPPVFSYGGTKEKIADARLTFEELRIQKADDFPELAEGKTVSWKVKYGAVTKSIADPKAKTIATVKEEIEQSKQFLDGLRKATGKDKNPDCLVTPSVIAKSKGIAAYKGFFLTEEDAEKSDKTICLIPSRSGRIMEMRKLELGRMVVPKKKIVEFAEVRAGFTPALPRIPREIMGQIVSFFRSFMNEDAEYEALVLLYWDRENEEFVPVVPKQRASKATVHANLAANCAIDEDRYLLYADIHSHNSMAAKFSAIDDRDERASRLYIVIGRLDRFYPDITARVSCGGTYLEIDPDLVVEGIGEDFPTEWLDQVERIPAKMNPAVSDAYRDEDEIDDGDADGAVNKLLEAFPYLRRMGVKLI